MNAYGNYVVQTAAVDSVHTESILRRDAEQVMKHLGVEGDLTFVFNSPYQAYDEETGEIVSGFASSWKLTPRSST